MPSISNFNFGFRAKSVVVLLSRNSSRSRWVEEELTHALKASKPVVPVLLDAGATENWIWPLVANRQAVTLDLSSDRRRNELEDLVHELRQYIPETTLLHKRRAPKRRVIVVATAVLLVTAATAGYFAFSDRFVRPTGSGQPLSTDTVQSDRSREIYDRAVALMASKQYEAAAAEFARVLEISPARTDALYNLGAVSMNLHRYADAIQYFNRVLTVNPQDERAFYNRGVSYMNLNRYREAEKDFTEVIRLAPSSRAYLNRARARAALGDAAGAAADEKAASHLDQR